MKQFLKLALAGLAGVAPGAVIGQTDGTLKWPLPIFSTAGSIASSPAVGPDGTIYVGSESNRLFAINPNGTEKWHYPLGLIVTTDWFDASPTVADDGTIYAGNFDGNLYALTSNGTLKWTYDTGSYIYSSASIAADGTIYVGAGDGSVHAINPDGSEKWIFATGDWVDSSPAIAADGTIYAGSWDNSLYAINPSGTLKWSVLTGNAITSSPAIGPDGTVYVGSADNNLYAVRPDGSVAWTFLTGDTVDASPVVGPDGNIYFGSADGYFYALKPDGSLAWPQPFDAGQGIFGGALIRADGSILFGCSDRQVYALNANGTLKWKYATGDFVDATPAVGPDGTIYVGSYDRIVHALNGNGAGLIESSWSKFRGDSLNQGRFTGSIVPSAPAISAQPQSQSVAFGTSVTFSVAVSGSQPFTFQWRKDGVDISGATGSSYIVDQATLADAGDYSVWISNSAGFATSGSATLAVAAPIAPAITVQPRPLVLPPGARLSLWVTVSGSNPMFYQWKIDGVDIPGANSAFYEVSSAALGDVGSYTVEVSNAAGSVLSGAAGVSISASAASQLIGISTRAMVGTGGSILIPGFYILGTDPRELLIRAVGPTLALAPFNVTGVLEDPTLTLTPFGGSPILINDNWEEAANAADIITTSKSVGAFGLPLQSADAVALVELPAGGYTVQISGVGATTGIALVEIYDVTGAGNGNSRLGTISTRANVGTGAAVAIPGFSISGNGAKTLLVRAVGPSLDALSVPDFMNDPVLTILDGSEPILTNDNWMEGPDVDALIAASKSVGAFGLESGSGDAAVLIVLMPGIKYTAIVSGVGGTSGNVLVEVYEVD